jgi:hypothetical protein
MHNLKVHKYLLCIFISFKFLKINISSIYNLLCETQTSLQINGFEKYIFECIFKMWFVHFIFNKIKYYLHINHWINVYLLSINQSWFMATCHFLWWWRQIVYCTMLMPNIDNDGDIKHNIIWVLELWFYYNVQHDAKSMHNVHSLSTITFYLFFLLVWHAPKGLPQDFWIFFSIQCIVKDLNALGVLSSSLHLKVKGACESFGMGLGWAPQVEFMDIWKCINQKKKTTCAFGTKLGHMIIYNSQGPNLGGITTFSLK